MTIKIVGVAVRVNGLTVSLLPPNRHFNVLQQMPSKFARLVKPSEQGFITNEGKFVGREEAKIIARNANQLLPTHSPNNECFSEDLW
jgi:hypothetical protein